MLISNLVKAFYDEAGQVVDSKVKRYVTSQPWFRNDVCDLFRTIAELAKNPDSNTIHVGDEVINKSDYVLPTNLLKLVNCPRVALCDDGAQRDLFLWKMADGPLKADPNFKVAFKKMNGDEGFSKEDPDATIDIEGNVVTPKQLKRIIESLKLDWTLLACKDLKNYVLLSGCELVCVDDDTFVYIGGSEVEGTVATILNVKFSGAKGYCKTVSETSEREIKTWLFR